MQGFFCALFPLSPLSDCGGIIIRGQSVSQGRPDFKQNGQYETSEGRDRSDFKQNVLYKTLGRESSCQLQCIQEMSDRSLDFVGRSCSGVTSQKLCLKPLLKTLSVKSEHYRLRAKRARATECEAFYPMPLKPLCSAEWRINNNIPNLTTLHSFGLNASPFSALNELPYITNWQFFYSST